MENVSHVTKEPESTENVTKCHTFGHISIPLRYEIETAERKEQRRTTQAKELFLEYYAKSRGFVDITCEKTGIASKTFYRWVKDDAEFARKVRDIDIEKPTVAEDILWGLITHKHDGPSIRFYLERKHPEYKNKLKVEGGMTITPNKSLEELLEEDAIKKLDKENDIHTGTNTGSDDGQPNTDRGVATNTGQEGEPKTV